MPPRRRLQERGTPIWAWCVGGVFFLGFLGVLIPAAILFARDGTVGVSDSTCALSTQPCFLPTTVGGASCVETDADSCVNQLNGLPGGVVGETCETGNYTFFAAGCPEGGCSPPRGACIGNNGCLEVDPLTCLDMNVTDNTTYYGHGTKCSHEEFEGLVNVTDLGACVDSYYDYCFIAESSACSNSATGTAYVGQDCGAAVNATGNMIACILDPLGDVDGCVHTAASVCAGLSGEALNVSCAWASSVGNYTDAFTVAQPCCGTESITGELQPCFEANDFVCETFYSGVVQGEAGDRCIDDVTDDCELTVEVEPFVRTACCLPSGAGCVEVSTSTCADVYEGTVGGAVGTTCEASTCRCTVTEEVLVQVL